MAHEVRRVAALWNLRPGSCLDRLARTGEIPAGCSSEALSLLVEAQAAGTVEPQAVRDLGVLWEWIERTGPRPAQIGWTPRPHYVRNSL